MKSLYILESGCFSAGAALTTAALIKVGSLAKKHVRWEVDPLTKKAITGVFYLSKAAFVASSFFAVMAIGMSPITIPAEAVFGPKGEMVGQFVAGWCLGKVLFRAKDTYAATLFKNIIYS